MNNKILDREYVQWLKVLKQKVLQAQLKAAAGTNRILIRLYWDLGREITEREKEFSYGENFLAKVAADLSHEFPEIKGFSRRNLYAIRQWYLFFSDHGGLVQQPVAQLPWRHQVAQADLYKKSTGIASAFFERGKGSQVDFRIIIIVLILVLILVLVFVSGMVVVVVISGINRSVAGIGDPDFSETALDPDPCAAASGTAGEILIEPRS